MADEKFLLKVPAILLNFKKKPDVLYFLIILYSILNFSTLNLNAQTLPVGTQVIEDYYRRSQLLGDLDSTISFTIRPLFPVSMNAKNSFNGDSLSREYLRIYGNSPNKGGIKILPGSWIQQYYSHPSYGWNNGAIIPAKGYQTLLSAGFFAYYGPLSIQMKPEFVFAENRKFNEFPNHYGSADLPVRFGQEPYSRLNWGQSSLRLNFKPISFGISNENLWWGPGIKNSILMSNNASGFKHLTLNTTSPVKTPIGSIEAQIVGGRLEASGYTKNLPTDWRYLSGLVLSYNPRWVPGLFLGLTRSFQTYQGNLKTFNDYLPLFRPFQKVKDKVQDQVGRDGQDQLTSLFGRWLLTKSRSEIYFEYGLNDHSYNARDFLMAPDHSRTYIIGFRKLIPYKIQESQYLQIGAELTHLEQSIDRIIRDSGEWYTHVPILHGYTHNGEVLGAGIGPGGNFQSLEFIWVSGLRQLGLQFERFKHNGDLTYIRGYQPWIDYSMAFVSTQRYKKFLLNGKVQAIQSMNYQWQSGFNGFPNQDIFNINVQIGLMYRF